VGVVSVDQQHAWFHERFEDLVVGAQAVVRGKAEQVRMTITCFVAGGHLLIEDRPGTGKTALARTLAALSDGSWNRVQFTPDLLPSDVTGVTIFNQRSQQFEFHQGPIFSNVVVADEINRASPKTQSALLEVMEEGHVTVDAATYAVPSPFMVLATQNPVEFDGTFRLPEAQMDRFLMRISLGYPSPDAEMGIIESGGANVTVPQVHPVVSIDMLQAMRTIVERVEVVPEVQAYVVALANETRSSSDLRLPVSTRGVMYLVRAARAAAAAEGRHFVRPEDIKALVPHVWAHRIFLTPEAEFRGLTTTAVLQDLLDRAPVRVGSA
jgi:MoxR-like ATPase